MKYILAVLGIICFVVSEQGFSKVSLKDNRQKTIKIRIASPAGIPAVTFLDLIKKKKLGDKVDYDLMILNGPTMIPSLVLKKEVDLIVIPVNLAAKLFNKGADFKLLGVSIWGSLDFISSSKKINSFKDLKDKTLHVFGKGSTPDILTRYFIKKSGGKSTRTHMIYQSPAINAKLAIDNRIDNVILPSHLSALVLKKNKKFHRVKNFNKEWRTVVGSDYSLPQAGVFVSNTFAKENYYLIKKFSNIYKKELANFIKNIEIHSRNAVDKGIFKNAKIIKVAKNDLYLNWKNSKESKRELNKYLSFLYNAGPMLIGGKIPNDDFLYLKE